MISPAGYFNQKAQNLKNFTEFYQKLKGTLPTREELLNVKGIGNETADAMLLYAYKKTEFVVDAYTRRIFEHLKIIPKNIKYEVIKKKFERDLTKDVIIYQ